MKVEFDRQKLLKIVKSETNHISNTAEKIVNKIIEQNPIIIITEGKNV